MTRAGDLDGVMRDVAEATRAVARLGLAEGVSAGTGHISMRVPWDSEQFVVKGRGYERDLLSEMTASDMIVCNLEGRLKHAPSGVTQSLEVLMHAGVYRARPDVGAVLHVHPRFTILLSTLGLRPRPMRNEGALLVAEPVPVYPHSKMVVTESDAAELTSCLGDAPAVILRGHGALTVGETLGQAAMRMMRLEEQSHMTWLACAAGGPEHADLGGPLLEEFRRSLEVRPAHFEAPLRINEDSLWDQCIDAVRRPG